MTKDNNYDISFDGDKWHKQRLAMALATSIENKTEKWWAPEVACLRIVIIFRSDPGACGF